jgi:hypothetical protein
MVPVSDALRERLGVKAAHDLEEFTENLSSRWSDNVLHTASERFDNRLAVEMAALRLEMQKGFGDLRVEVLRWSFLFWIGQVAAVAGLLTFMLNRGLR